MRGPSPVPLDYREGLAGYENDRELYEEVLSEFAKELFPRLASIHGAMGDLDFSVIRTHSHTICGGAGTIAAHPLSKISGELEAAAIKQDAGTCRQLLPKLSEEVERFLLFLGERKTG